ncbi:MAG: beta-propeller fold lactonase family protein [Planctomycetota bacterium]
MSIILPGRRLLLQLTALTPFARLLQGNEKRSPLAVVSLTGERRLAVFRIDPRGNIGPSFQAATDARPGATCFDSTGRHLYVGGDDPSSIRVHRLESSELVALQTVNTPAKPSYLQVTPSGQFLLAAYYSTGQVTVHRIVGEGRISQTPIQLLDVDANAHCITMSPDGKFVFVPHTKPSRISQFRFDANTGKLTPNDPPFVQRAPGICPRHLWFHPNGHVVFGSNERDCSVSTYQFDGESGGLTESQTVSSLPAGTPPTGSTSHIEVHPNGEVVYIANRKTGTMAVFSFNTTTEQLSLVQHARIPTVVRSFAIAPGGRFLLTAGQSSDRLVCYRIASDGSLTQTDERATGKTPWWISFSPTTGSSNVLETQGPPSVPERSLGLGQGTMSGEVTDQTAIIQTRLTMGTQLEASGDLPGSPGVVKFQWSRRADLSDSNSTPLQFVKSDNDFIAKSSLTGLQPGTTYYYRAWYGASKVELRPGPICSFQTLPGSASSKPVEFVVGSCMNYIKFIHGREGNARGPITATDEDKQLGFPAFETMRGMNPAFFVGTGDIVYYDNPYRVARTRAELRQCWHEQFRFPRMIQFFAQTPTYWSKDDHDFRYNDSDNESDRRPLPKTGVDLFYEQLPISTADASRRRTYRTMRVNQDLQIWLTEGRDYRSPNDAQDGPQKSMWGAEQLEWIKSSLLSSDATWKVMINPTPMVGPDDAYKSDNHTTRTGFRHEADAFFDWVVEHDLQENLVLVCGDRHWQYHSIHPSGVNEFACGAINDENARMGVAPGDEFGSDPDGDVLQLFTSPEPSGGFLHVSASEVLSLTHINHHGKRLNEAVIASRGIQTRPTKS